jgi:hypothetical protein
MPGQPVRQRPEAVMVPDTLLCVVVPVRDLRDPHDELDVHVGLVQLAADRTTLSWKCPSSAACPAARGGCHRLPVGSLMLLSPPKVCREVGLGCSVKTTTRQGTAVRKTCRTRRSGRASRPCRTRWAWRCPGEAAAVVHSSLGPRPVPVVPRSCRCRAQRSRRRAGASHRRTRPISLSASLTADPTNTPAVNERRDAKHRGCPRGGNHSDDRRDHVPDVGCDVDVQRWTGKWHADHPGGRKRLCGSRW